MQLKIHQYGELIGILFLLASTATQMFYLRRSTATFNGASRPTPCSNRRKFSSVPPTIARSRF